MSDRSSTDGEPYTKIDTSVPHSARIWNYWSGGKDNYAVDREAGDAFAATFPGVFDLAKQARQFLIRAVTYLATDAGIRQFLDIGTGLPTLENTHEVAQRAASDARIVYVDNDPLVLTHARALLTNTTDDGVTAYVNADLHHPEQVVADARNILNLTQPVAVMFMGVLGHVADDDEMRSIVARVMAAVPSGSYLVMWDGTSTSDDQVRALEDYKDTGAVPYIGRSPEQIARCFEGLEILEPGLVPVSHWRPDPDAGTVAPVDGYGAVARKP
ncbi:SAM-dependent methyltransferase [Phytohabitans sp. ZYX-F-186]|uniref:SAM-dependent methyltransferase n=1 Tax=Phytohabitans maris TaxID=3071409 RepID=A0ABU0ZFZ7_9ACTN|nr:SAM-dependent methyltransferase [Phytohabitans sp. ZYX-F-186]MDQ7905195.1 SAM-dependent methyltransferase [Phytohabitans sp. ZYX-F-186]